METGASVSIRGMSKSYGPVLAVDNVSIDVQGGEFVALLGPSGSGKSTILTSIAGFELPNSGDILLDGRRINEQPPHRRGIGMVFQHFALFPHMTVAENIAYPLRRRGATRKAIQRDVARVLEMVSLEGYAPRFPSQLSGGQQQRVALARALIFNPRVLLMDEPLGSLDRKLRQQMQMEIKLLHRDVRTTIIFVTHDQEEALSMADRIGVMNHGKLQQIGSPAMLYEMPASAFVAGFIGETNFLPVQIAGMTDTSATLRIDGTEASFEVPKANVCTNDVRALLAMRPEHLQLCDRGHGIPATIVETAYAGSSLNILLESVDHRITARVQLPGDGRSRLPGQEVGWIPQAALCRVYSFEEKSKIYQ